VEQYNVKMVQVQNISY